MDENSASRKDKQTRRESPRAPIQNSGGIVRFPAPIASKAGRATLEPQMNADERGRKAGFARRSS
jgi:hypothetical protein